MGVVFIVAPIIELFVLVHLFFWNIILSLKKIIRSNITFALVSWSKRRRLLWQVYILFRLGKLLVGKQAKHERNLYPGVLQLDVMTAVDLPLVVLEVGENLFCYCTERVDN